MAFVRRRPVLAYWLVAVGLELLLIPLFLLSGADAAITRGLDAAGLTFNTDLVTAGRVVVAAPAAAPGVLLSLAQVASPDLAVLLVVAVLGRGQLRAVARRLRFWAPEVGTRAGLRIWALAIAASCALNLASAGLHALGPATMDFRWDLQPLTFAFIGGLLVAMFLDAGALFEENGWRGFALPALQDRVGPVRAAALVGLMWAAWHVPVKFGIFLDFGVLRGGLLFAVLTAKFVALSIVIAYFFNRAGQATILAIALHGLSNDSVRIGGDVLGESWATQIRTEADLLIPLALLAVAMAWRTRGRLGSSVSWHDATVDTRRLLGTLVRPVRRPGAAGRLAWALGAVAAGPAIAVVLLAGGLASVVLAPIGIGLAIAGCMLLTVRWAGHGDRRLAAALLGVREANLDVPVLPPGPSARHRVRALALSTSSWRALAWFAVRALLGIALGGVLLVCTLAAIAFTLIPFADGWLVWGTFATHSGLASAWTLLFLPIPLLLALHAVDLTASVAGTLAGRLLGPDPGEELEAWRRRAYELRTRSRAAEDLHDHLGHELTVMTLQASAAQRSDDLTFVAGALAAIEASGRRAAAQLDDVLGRLGDSDPAWAGETDLGGLEGLIAGLRAAGVSAELEVSGEVDAVPPGLGAELFRVAQEACTNVLRHAGGAATRIAVAVGTDEVRLSVINASAGPGVTATVGENGAGRRNDRPGQGLPGIARRMRRLGGAAEQGATDDGGYRVSVRAPLPGGR